MHWIALFLGKKSEKKILVDFLSEINSTVDALNLALKKKRGPAAPRTPAFSARISILLQYFAFKQPKVTTQHIDTCQVVGSGVSSVGLSCDISARSCTDIFLVSE